MEDLRQKCKCRQINTVFCMILAVFLVMLCPLAVLAEDGGVSGGVFVTGCSVAEGSIVSSMSVFTFSFTNNVVNASVRDNNRTKFSLETADGFPVEIYVDMADDQIEPNLRRYITVIPQMELAKGFYRLTAHAGIGAHNGNFTTSDFTVNFYVDRDEEEPDQENGLEPGSTPDPEPESGPEEYLPSGSEDSPTPKPEDSLIPEADSTIPISSPSPKKENEQTDAKRNPSLFPGMGNGTDGGDGSGQGQSLEDGAGSGEGTGLSNDMTQFFEEDRQTSQGSNTIPASAAAHLATDSRNIQKMDRSESENRSADEELDIHGSDIMDETSAPSERISVIKINLDGAGEEHQLLYRQGDRADPLSGSYEGEIIYGSGGGFGRTGGTILLILAALLCSGVAARTARFRRDIV